MDTRTRACLAVFTASCFAVVEMSCLFNVPRFETALLVGMLLCAIEIILCLCCQMHETTEAICFACLVVSGAILSFLILGTAVDYVLRAFFGFLFHSRI